MTHFFHRCLAFLLVVSLVVDPALAAVSFNSFPSSQPAFSPLTHFAAQSAFEEQALVGALVQAFVKWSKPAAIRLRKMEGAAAPAPIPDPAPAMRWGGQGLTDEVHVRVVNPVIKSYFDRPEKPKPLAINDPRYQALDPEGVLGDNQIRIFVLPGLNNAIRDRAFAEGIQNYSDIPFDLVDHPGRKRGNVYIDPDALQQVLLQSAAWRKKWALHAQAHIDNPTLDEKQVQDIAPLPTPADNAAASDISQTPVPPAPEEVVPPARSIHDEPAPLPAETRPAEKMHTPQPAVAVVDAIPAAPQPAAADAAPGRAIPERIRAILQNPRAAKTLLNYRAGALRMKDLGLPVSLSRLSLFLGHSSHAAANNFLRPYGAGAQDFKEWEDVGFELLTEEAPAPSLNQPAANTPARKKQHPGAAGSIGAPASEPQITAAQTSPGGKTEEEAIDPAKLQAFPNEQPALANLLKHLRKTRGMSQTKFGALIGVHTSLISRYEKQELLHMTPTTLPKLLALPELRHLAVSDSAPTEVEPAAPVSAKPGKSDRGAPIGDVLRSVREKRQLDLETMAARLGVEVSYLVRVEAGKAKPTPQLIQAALQFAQKEAGASTPPSPEAASTEPVAPEQHQQSAGEQALGDALVEAREAEGGAVSSDIKPLEENPLVSKIQEDLNNALQLLVEAKRLAEQGQQALSAKNFQKAKAFYEQAYQAVSAAMDGGKHPKTGVPVQGLLPVYFEHEESPVAELKAIAGQANEMYGRNSIFARETQQMQQALDILETIRAENGSLTAGDLKIVAVVQDVLVEALTIEPGDLTRLEGFLEVIRERKMQAGSSVGSGAKSETKTSPPAVNELLDLVNRRIPSIAPQFRQTIKDPRNLFVYVRSRTFQKWQGSENAALLQQIQNPPPVSGGREARQAHELMLLTKILLYAVQEYPAVYSKFVEVFPDLQGVVRRPEPTSTVGPASSGLRLKLVKELHLDPMIKHTPGALKQAYDAQTTKRRSDLYELYKRVVLGKGGSAMRWSGQGLTETVHDQVVNPVIQSYFASSEKPKPLSWTDSAYTALDASGLLMERQVRIYVLPGLNQKILAKGLEVGVPYADIPVDLVDHPGRERGNIYLDADVLPELLKRSPEWRRIWALHVLAHMDNRDLDEAHVQALARLPTRADDGWAEVPADAEAPRILETSQSIDTPAAEAVVAAPPALAETAPTPEAPVAPAEEAETLDAPALTGRVETITIEGADQRVAAVLNDAAENKDQEQIVREKLAGIGLGLYVINKIFIYAREHELASLEDLTKVPSVSLAARLPDIRAALVGRFEVEERPSAPAPADVQVSPESPRVRKSKSRQPRAFPVPEGMTVPAGIPRNIFGLLLLPADNETRQSALQYREAGLALQAAGNAAPSFGEISLKREMSAAAAGVFFYYYDIRRPDWIAWAQAGFRLPTPGEEKAAQVIIAETPAALPAATVVFVPPAEKPSAEPVEISKWEPRAEVPEVEALLPWQESGLSLEDRVIRVLRGFAGSDPLIALQAGQILETRIGAFARWSPTVKKHLRRYINDEVEDGGDFYDIRDLDELQVFLEGLTAFSHGDVHVDATWALTFIDALAPEWPEASVPASPAPAPVLPKVERPRVLPHTVTAPIVPIIPVIAAPTLTDLMKAREAITHKRNAVKLLEKGEAVASEGHLFKGLFYTAKAKELVGKISHSVLNTIQAQEVGRLHDQIDATRAELLADLEAQIRSRVDEHIASVEQTVLEQWIGEGLDQALVRKLVGEIEVVYFDANRAWLETIVWQAITDKLGLLSHRATAAHGRGGSTHGPTAAAPEGFALHVAKNQWVDESVLFLHEEEEDGLHPDVQYEFDQFLKVYAKGGDALSKFTMRGLKGIFVLRVTAQPHRRVFFRIFNNGAGPTIVIVASDKKDKLDGKGPHGYDPIFFKDMKKTYRKMPATGLIAISRRLAGIVLPFTQPTPGSAPGAPGVTGDQPLATHTRLWKMINGIRSLLGRPPLARETQVKRAFWAEQTPYLLWSLAVLAPLGWLIQGSLSPDQMGSFQGLGASIAIALLALLHLEFGSGHKERLKWYKGRVVSSGPTTAADRRGFIGLALKWQAGLLLAPFLYLLPPSMLEAHSTLILAGAGLLHLLAHAYAMRRHFQWNKSGGWLATGSRLNPAFVRPLKSHSYPTLVLQEDLYDALAHNRWNMGGIVIPHYPERPNDPAVKTDADLLEPVVQQALEQKLPGAAALRRAMSKGDVILLSASELSGPAVVTTPGSSTLSATAEGSVLQTLWNHRLLLEIQHLKHGKPGLWAPIHRAVMSSQDADFKNFVGLLREKNFGETYLAIEKDPEIVFALAHLFSSYGDDARTLALAKKQLGEPVALILQRLRLESRPTPADVLEARLVSEKINHPADPEPFETWTQIVAKTLQALRRSASDAGPGLLGLNDKHSFGLAFFIPLLATAFFGSTAGMFAGIAMAIGIVGWTAAVLVTHLRVPRGFTLRNALHRFNLHDREFRSAA